MPESSRTFSGYRLLQEFAALPQRLMFFEVRDLASRLPGIDAGEIDLVLLFHRGDTSLQPVVKAASLSLFCTPAINLFQKKLDRVPLGSNAWEYHLVPDRARPMDFEVHSVQAVSGFGRGNARKQNFLPLYASVPGDDAAEGSPPHGYYTTRRAPRLPSDRQTQQGARTAYLGEEVYLSLVDPRHVPCAEDELRQLSVSAWVSNRDLPLLLPAPPANAAGQSPELWRLDAPGPVSRVDALRGPSRPVSRRPVGEPGWSLVNHLSLNHLSLLDESPERAAASLRTLLRLYAPPEDAAWARQIEGVRTLSARSIVRRLPFEGPLCFGTGSEISLELDELAFQGASAFMLACVLERFFARHAAINSFTQLVLRTAQRGEVMRWAPRAGWQEPV